MLLLEFEVNGDSSESPDGLGEIAHFYAVSSHVFQHPISINYTAEAIARLRQSVEDHLFERSTLPELRHRIRRAANGAARITRRTGEIVVKWPTQSWPFNIEGVIAGGAAGYGRRVRNWAESVIVTLRRSTPNDRMHRGGACAPTEVEHQPSLPGDADR